MVVHRLISIVVIQSFLPKVRSSALEPTIYLSQTQIPIQSLPLNFCPTMYQISPKPSGAKLLYNQIHYYPA